MTNTLHRQGTPESLAGDYVVFLTPAGGINRQGCGEKKLTPRQAARYLARPCVCGAFNIERAETLLAKAVEMA